MNIVEGMTARELLRQTKGIPSFAAFKIPDYTQSEFETLRLDKRVVEVIRIQHQNGLLTRMEDFDHESFLQAVPLKWPDLIAYTKYVRTWGQHFDFCKARWRKQWTEMVQQDGLMMWEEPYHSNNFRLKLETMWKGERSLWGKRFPKDMLKLVASYKENSGWVELPNFHSGWDQDYVIYPIFEELKRKGFKDLER